MTDRLADGQRPRRLRLRLAAELRSLREQALHGLGRQSPAAPGGAALLEPNDPPPPPVQPQAKLLGVGPLGGQPLALAAELLAQPLDLGEQPPQVAVVGAE